MLQIGLCCLTDSQYTLWP